MKYFLTILIMLSCATFMSTYVHAQQYHGDKSEIDRIIKASQAFSKAYMNKDYDIMANYYTEDGKILPPGAGIIEGRKLIRERWLLPDNVQVIHHKSSPTEIKIIDGYAYDFGYYEGETRQANGNIAAWKGKYVIIWKKINNEWLMYVDMWNRID